MATSTAATAKQRILDLLAARPALAAVKRTWAEPTQQGDHGADHVWFGDTDQSEEWGSLGAHARNENYVIELTAVAYLPGDDPQAAEARGWTLQGEISQALRSDPSLGGLLSQYAELQTTRMTVDPASAGGWVARANLRVHCVARI